MGTTHSACLENTNPTVFDIKILELPELEVDDLSNPADGQPHVLIINEVSSFQWVCSVEARKGDELLWLHNGEPIPSASNISQVRCRNDFISYCVDKILLCGIWYYMVSTTTVETLVYV